MTIFYADDDDRDLFREAVHEINEKINVQIAADGHQALQNLTNLEETPAFIFLDINMPGMTGIQCLEELKLSPKLRKIPVIMYTTTNDKATRKLCFSNGAQDYIVKPNSFEQVISLLRKVFNKDYTPIFKEA